MPKKTMRMTLGTTSIGRTVRDLDRYGRELSRGIYALLDALLQDEESDTRDAAHIGFDETEAFK